MSRPTRPVTSVRRRLRLLVAVLAGCLTLTACDFDVYELPLPGGADVGNKPLHITVEFADVLDLVPKSTVKVDDVDVGRIDDITLDGQTAEVSITLNDDADLPANAVARIRQTSLLGEKFVDLAPPETGASSEPLADGDTIPISRTGRNPEVEEVLGALSLVLNGGGVAQLKTIAAEVNTTLEGREAPARDLLTQVDTLMGQLDANKGTIVDAIRRLNRLALSVRGQQGSIDRALEELPSALDSLDRQRDDLVRALKALDRLSDVGVRVIRRTKQTTVQSLTQLQPTLTKLADSGDDLVNSLYALPVYPFVDEVVGRDPQVARNLQIGDYTNLSVELDLDLSELQIPCTPLAGLDLNDLPVFEGLCDDAQDALSACADNFTKNCVQALIDAVCSQTPIPADPLCNLLGGSTLAGGDSAGGEDDGLGGLGGSGGLGGLTGGDDGSGLGDLGGGITGDSGGGGSGGSGSGNGSSGAGTGTGDGDSGGASGGGLGDLGLGGLNPRVAPTRSSTQSIRTLQQLMDVYDPGLASLLTPGMVLR